ncbi:MAG TPA: 30S ribosomal protein S16 [Patescibacteria group bacterium]|jgi:ribosomal protein S16|nr:30S ribosomal protein S16 [Patescibacteria group bacterium]
MLTIRLQRAGKKNKPEYRIVLADKTAAAQKKFTEVLGSYNPHTKALTIRDQERLNYWKDEQHVELSATVRNLLITKEIIKGDKTKAFTIPKKEVVAEEAPAAPAETSTEAPATEEAPSETPAEEVAEAVAPEAPAEVETPAEPEAPVAEAAPEVEAPAETPTETPAEAPATEETQV